MRPRSVQPQARRIGWPEHPGRALCDARFEPILPRATAALQQSLPGAAAAPSDAPRAARVLTNPIPPSPHYPS